MSPLIIYSAKTDKVPLNLKEWNLYKSYLKVKNYNPDYQSCDFGLIGDVYHTYTILVSFNNGLASGNNIQVFEELNKNLNDHLEIENSKDNKYRYYYSKMCCWYNQYRNNPEDNTYKKICKDVNLCALSYSPAFLSIRKKHDIYDSNAKIC